MDMNRRGFFKLLGAGATAVALPALPSIAKAAPVAAAAPAVAEAASLLGGILSFSLTQLAEERTVEGFGSPAITYKMRAEHEIEFEMYVTAPSFNAHELLDGSVVLDREWFKAHGMKGDLIDMWPDGMAFRALQVNVRIDDGMRVHIRAMEIDI
jgi:hypothetical protein